MSPRYVLVSPCRDEAEFLARTVESVVAQTVRPHQWVIVDDGSTDGTREMLEAYAREHSFIKVVSRDDRGERAVGPGVIQAFNQGLAAADADGADYLCKLDMDLDLPAGYFEALIERMQANPRQGTVSGKAYYEGPDGELISEAIGDDMSAGMTKFYRKSCFDEIGGFVGEVMWDGIDCHRCRMLGWMAGSFDGPDLRFIHLRQMGSSHRNVLTGRMRHGYGQWFMGTGLMFMTASAAFRATRPPYVVGGLAMWVGYVKSMLAGRPRYEHPGFRAFLRGYHRNCLLRGKRRTLEKLHEERAGTWRQRKQEELRAATTS